MLLKKLNSNVGMAIAMQAHPLVIYMVVKVFCALYSVTKIRQQQKTSTITDKMAFHATISAH